MRHQPNDLIANNSIQLIANEKLDTETGKVVWNYQREGVGTEKKHKHFRAKIYAYI